MSKTKSFLVIAGTTAELLKLWPVMLNLSQSENVEVVLTGQHEISSTLVTLLKSESTSIDFIAKNLDIAASKLDTFLWLVLTVPRLFKYLVLKKFVEHKKYEVIVHGDTLSTFFGAIVGKMMRFRVFHVEAGYRTNDWRNPFPEELLRRAVGKIADVHFCPSDNEAKNISRRNPCIVVTGGNTGLDSLSLALDAPEELVSLPYEVSHWLKTYERDFGILTLHRFELLAKGNLDSSKELERELRKISNEIGLLIPTGKFERAQLESIVSAIDQPNILLCEKFEYLSFAFLLKRANFVITDSGGLAQECNALGTPCFVARENIEESTLRKNSVLITTRFLNLGNLVNHSEKYRVKSLLPVFPSPSALVTKELVYRASSK